jgi:hypothetical protein
MKKIVCFLVMMLTIIATIIGPSTSSTEYKLSPGVVDQEQQNNSQLHWLEGGVPHWQQFVNRGNNIEEIELYFGCYYLGSYDVTLSIEKMVGGPALTSVTYPASYFPDNQQDWVTFNLPDVALDKNAMYYMVIRFDPGSEYAWSGDTGNPYTQGQSSRSGMPDWDYAFKTIVDKSKPKTINTIFQNLLEHFLNLFPMFQKIINMIYL